MNAEKPRGSAYEAANAERTPPLGRPNAHNLAVGMASASAIGRAVGGQVINCVKHRLARVPALYRMWCWVGLLLVTFATSFCLVEFWLLAPASLPQDLVCLPDDYDAGPVHQGAIVLQEFEVKNLTAEPIRISRVQSNCSCVSISGIRSLLSKPVPSNGSARVTVSVEALGVTKELKGLARLHYQAGGKSSYLDLVVRGTVLEDYELRACDAAAAVETWSMGEFSDFTERERELRFCLHPLSRQNIQITAVHMKSEDLWLQSLEKREFSLRYKCPDFAAATKISIPVVVETTSKQKPNSLVMLVGEYMPAVQASPMSVAIAASDIGAARRLVRVTSVEPSRLILAQIKGCPAKLVGAPSGDSLETVHELIVEAPESSKSYKGVLHVKLQAGNRIFCKDVPITRFCSL